MICPKEFDYPFMAKLHCVPDPIFIVKSYALPSSIVYIFRWFGLNINSMALFPVQLHALVFALFASLIAPFGGFFASGIKRAYGVKDFDTLFPGHGGVTDRMDCQFIMGLFTYVYYTVFIGYLTLNYASIIYSIEHLPKQDQYSIYVHLNKIFGNNATTLH